MLAIDTYDSPCANPASKICNEKLVLPTLKSPGGARGAAVIMRFSQCKTCSYLLIDYSLLQPEGRELASDALAARVEEGMAQTLA